MRVWRICRRRFADLSGEGARLHGGRWNSPGRPLIYAAEAAALAVLEVRVNLDLAWDVLPEDFVLMAIDLQSSKVDELTALPPDSRETGDAWLASGRSAYFKVPSVIVPESCNILINVAHREASGASLGPIRSLAFDERLWRPRWGAPFATVSITRDA